MSYPLFKATTRSNWLIAVGIIALMLVYMATIVSMYDPAGNEALNAYISSLPAVMMEALGFSEATPGLIGFMASYYYGFIVLLFPLIYTTITANRLVAAHVDRGSMAYLLSTPNTRVRIVTTQAVYLLASVTVLFLVVAAVGAAMAQALFPGMLDTGKFLLLNLNAWLLFCAVSAISFFFSCAANESKYSLALGAGIPVLFFVMQMLANVGPKLEWLRALTVFSLFRPEEVLKNGMTVVWSGLVLAALAIVLYAGGVMVFSRKDLAL